MATVTWGQLNERSVVAGRNREMSRHGRPCLKLPAPTAPALGVEHWSQRSSACTLGRGATAPTLYRQQSGGPVRDARTRPAASARVRQISDLGTTQQQVIADDSDGCRYQPGLWQAEDTLYTEPGQGIDWDPWREAAAPVLEKHGFSPSAARSDPEATTGSRAKGPTVHASGSSPAAPCSSGTSTSMRIPVRTPPSA